MKDSKLFDKEDNPIIFREKSKLKITNYILFTIIFSVAISLLCVFIITKNKSQNKVIAMKKV